MSDYSLSEQLAHTRHWVDQLMNHGLEELIGQMPHIESVPAEAEENLRVALGEAFPGNPEVAHYLLALGRVIAQAENARLRTVLLEVRALVSDMLQRKLAPTIGREVSDG